jgi:hypothetical protein
MPIDPSELTKSIGALGTLDPDHDLAPTLQQVVLAAKQLFRADGAGLMLIDRQGQLRWASASDQTAQMIEDGQERLAQGPCMAAFSQRARRCCATSAPNHSGASWPRCWWGASWRR